MLKIMNPEENKRQTNNAVQKNQRLHEISPVETYLLQNSPLPISYDVNRPQPWYFTEYSYTEFMGGILVVPMSDEMSCKNIINSLRDQSKFNAEEVIYNRLHTEKTLDKYKLNLTPEVNYDDVVVLPGSNILNSHVSKELLMRVMWERPEAVIKPHPLTHDKDLIQLKKQYGHHRVLLPKLSGWTIIKNAKTVYTTSSTELAMYACLFGKKVETINSITLERTGSYYPIFRLIAGVNKTTARKNLLKALNSNSSGIIFVDDPNYTDKINKFFDVTLKLRKKYKPLVYNSFSYPQLLVQQTSIDATVKK